MERVDGNEFVLERVDWKASKTNIQLSCSIKYGNKYSALILLNMMLLKVTLYTK